jgi:leucyl aminopeptidase
MHVEKFNKYLDDLVTDLIVAPIFEDDRPPQGIAGLIDWRLNGFLSKAILNGAIVGMKGEHVLLPLSQRLPARRLLLIGLGKRGDFSLAEARHVAYKIGKTLKGLNALDAAIGMPPCKDEREPGDTDRTVINVLEEAGLPKELMIRFLAPPRHDWEVAIPSTFQGTSAPQTRSLI